MSIIKGRPVDSDITIMNTWYLRPKKNNDGNWDDGSMTVVYRDNKTQKKYHQYTKNPKCRFYIAKPEVYLTHNELFLPESKLDKVIVPYKDQLKKIAELTDNTDFYYNNIRNGNRAANNELYGHVRIFDADYDIENHWREMFDEQYTNTPGTVNKSFFDIEVDSINAMGDFPEPGECPVNAVTLIDLSHQQVHTFILENKNNPLIEQFKNSINENLFAELKAFIREQVGGWKNEKRFGLDKLNYNFHFYKEEDEIKLIQDLFIAINTYRPDFILAWNMAFDIPYIMARIKKLGYRPEDIMCDPEFEEKIAEYFVDEKNYNDYAERNDYARISSYAVFVDQMIQFASRRKGQGAFRSFKLDDIGEAIAKVRKYDYHHITNSLPKLPYMDFKAFIFYNIMDTIVQVCIESRTGDMDYLFNKCLINNTKYAKAHRQTVYLRNRGEKSFRSENEEVYIMGCNVNALHPSDEKFKGAFVADARKISDYAKMRICDVPVMLFPNLVDYDYKALYPSTMRQMNMAPNTIFGYIDIPKPVFPNENRYHVDRFVRGGSYLEDLQSHVFLEFGSRWFRLADYGELYDDVIAYLSAIGRFVSTYDPYNNTINPFVCIDKSICPDPFITNTGHRVSPFVINTPISREVRFNEDNFKEAQYVNIKF